MRWTDDTIRLDFYIPSGIRALMELLEKADQEKDFGVWFNAVDLLDVACKNACGAGQITEAQWYLICNKYSLERCLEEE